MKNTRQAVILDIIREGHIETQDELSAALRERGIQVTQATISRDIREMRLIKVLGPGGNYEYALPEIRDGSMADRFGRMLAEAVVSTASSGNLVVIKTLSGSANMAAEAVDSLHWPEVLGTLAGDNTILLVARTDEEAPLVAERLQRLIR
ncbi:MAG: arginine repressor [Clostridia bacterium]|nr:arginine repressor [Clostridia bacterium]